MMVSSLRRSSSEIGDDESVNSSMVPREHHQHQLTVLKVTSAAAIRLLAFDLH